MADYYDRNLYCQAKEPLIKELRERTASLLRARKLAYNYDKSHFLRAQLHPLGLALYLAHRLNQRFPNGK